MGTTSADLWDTWLAKGDESVFESLVRPELPAIYHLAQGMGLASSDAEDVVQDALLQLAQVKNRRPSRVGIGAWLMRTVRLRALMAHRTTRRRRRHEQRGGRRTDGAPLAAPRLDVEEEVERALKTLGEDDRQILVFRFLYDLSYPEIAYVLGASENACRIRVHRASERLRARIGRRSTALLALLPLPAFPKSTPAIAAALKGGASATPGAASAGFIGGVIVTTAWKMVASAAVAAAVTAGAFIALEERPAPRPERPLVENAGLTDDPPVARRDVPESVRDAEPVAPPRLQGVPDASGSGVITGRVADPTGAGVGGVVIVATPLPRRPRAPSDLPPPELDLDEELRRAAEATRRRVGGTRRATTSPSGTYRLTGLADNGYVLRAYARGYEFGSVRGTRLYDVKPGATVDFTAKSITEVRIEIQGLDPSLGERVGILRASDEEHLKRAGAAWWTPEHPVLRMPPGTWWLQAVAGEDREWASLPRQVTLEAGRDTQTIVLRLESRPGLCGTISFGDDIEVHRVELWALPFAGDDAPSVEGMRRGQGVVRGRYDRRRMRYEFPDIAPGRYRVGVTLGTDRIAASAVVEIVDRMVEQDFEIGIGGLRRYTVVRVLGPEGTALDTRQTQIQYSYDGPQATIGGGGEAIGRTDGSWLVTPNPLAPSAEDAAGGIHRLQVTFPGLGTREVTYDPDAGHEVEVRFQRPGSLTVRVSGLEEAGLKGRVGLYLKQHLEAEGLALSSRGATAAGNTFRFTEVQPGSWHVVMVLYERPAGRARQIFIMVDRRTMSVAEGENHLDWAVPPLYTVRLEPAEKEEPLRFGLTRVDGDLEWMHQFAASAAGDDVVFLFVPPGRYRIKGRYAGGERVRIIDVPSQTVVRLE